MIIYASPLRYYRSTDATIDATDAEVGTAASIDALAADATSNQTATDNPTVAGTFYYGVCIVASGDSDTSNDCSAGVRVDVAAQDFDLSVTAFSVSPSSIVAGEAITFAATVTNDASATVSSSVATLKYYRSTDATIDSTTDTEVGTADSIGALAAAATESETAIVNPSTAGTFYYGACVVSTGDSDTSNDCSTGMQVDVAAQDFDLSVTAFSVSPSSIVAGEAITFAATVTNDSSATVSSSVAELKYYRSTDATIDATDTEVGTADSISALAAAATESETAIVNPSTAGTFYYGACVVGAGDSNTSNDCSAGMQVVVAARDFDLSVTAFSVTDSSMPTDEPITFTATVGNASSATVSSPVATLKYYRSTDATIDATDTEVGTADSIGALAAAATESKTAIVNPSIAGTFYYGACVVGAGDSDTSNDCSAGVQVVVERVFDLSVTAFSVSESSVPTDEPIIFTATVGNDSSATVSSPYAVLRYYRSTDAVIYFLPSNRAVAEGSIAALTAGATETETASVTVPSTIGTYYYGACVFSTGDSDTSNNCSAAVQVVVAARDFDLSVITFSTSDSSIVVGDNFRLGAKVGNASSSQHSSPAAKVRYYRSTDATITSGDTEVSLADSIGALAAGATASKTNAHLRPSLVGTYYYGACIEVTGDSDPSNNCSAGVQLVGTARDFDLSVTAFSASDTSVVVGDDITFTATVHNDASALHSSTSLIVLTYYRSTDATIDTTDSFVAYRYIIGGLGVGRTETVLMNVEATTAGTYYYGVCAAPSYDVDDSDPSNNCSTGVQVVVVEPGFDLSVTTFSVSDTSVLTNEPITFTATVGNASSTTVSSPATTLRYYRSTDATITSADTEVGTADSISALAASATESETATDSPSTAGTYYYGACVVAAGDSDTSNNCSTGVQVDVAEPDFDLSVTAFSVSDSSPLTNESIRLSATVTNASSATVSSPAATLRYYRSTDATITSADTEVGVADSISALAAAATESETATDSPSTAGTYYYGACVVATGDSDTSNDCSAGVQVVVATQDFDLSVTTFSIRDASAARVGSRIWFDATVGNDSSATVSSPDRSVLSFYRSSDATISSSDIAFARDSIGALAAGETDNESESEILGTAGTHYYYACIFATGDSDTSNDCSAVVQVDVAARNFDLSVTAFSVNSSSVVAGDDITLTATVRNDASALHSSPATVIALRYYRSSDSTIETTDTFLDYKSVTELAAGATETILNTLRAPAAGTYYYGACIEVTGDSDTGNDCSAGVQVVVTASSP